MKPGDAVLIMMDVDKEPAKSTFIRAIDNDTCQCASGVFYTAAVWPASAEAEIRDLQEERRLIRKLLEDNLEAFLRLRSRTR